MDKTSDLVHDELLLKNKEIKSYLKRQHSIKGTCCEDILRTALLQFVPQNYSMANGVLWYNGESSKQIDIIIYNNTKAKLVTLVPGIIVIEPEAVKVAIEVKSTIRNKGIKSTIKNALLVCFVNYQQELPNIPIYELSTTIKLPNGIAGKSCRRVSDNKNISSRIENNQVFIKLTKLENVEMIEIK